LCDTTFCEIIYFLLLSKVMCSTWSTFGECGRPFLCTAAQSEVLQRTLKRALPRGFMSDIITTTISR
jgi:hypothetical protein